MRTRDISIIIFICLSMGLTGCGGSSYGGGGNTYANNTSHMPITYVPHANYTSALNRTAIAPDAPAQIMEGMVISFSSKTEFKVNGRFVTTTDKTFFINGNASDIALNRLLKVEGKPDADYVLVADKITFEG